MADGGYRGNPEVIIPYRKPGKGKDLPERKEELNTVHKSIRARVEHALAHLKSWNILRDAGAKARASGTPPEASHRYANSP